MLEFSGRMSPQCQKYILRLESLLALKVASIISFIFSIPAIALAFKVHWIFIIFIPVLIIYALLAGMPVSKKNYDNVIPLKITININEKTIISQNKRFSLERDFSEVVTVNDMGGWYHIYFGERIDRIGRFVCQKDLICGGTIEEFEELFKEKIVLKTKRNGSLCD